MLHTRAVPVNLLEVLTDLQEKTSANGFALAGGTSLALRYGHRLSVDLDFFTGNDFESIALAEKMGVGPDFITGQAKGTLQLLIHQVKVEFLKHSYRQLAPHDSIQNIDLWSVPDVAAMKLNAIANRGSKKDFYDIAALLDQYTLETLIGYYKEKYNPASLLMLIRSLSWFDDADDEPNPVSLSGVTWPEIKEKISNAIRNLE
jgi:predicted nucleotidyltransferase component of viral defense system